MNIFKNKFNKIRSRLLIFFLLVTLIPLIISFYFASTLITEIVETGFKRSLLKAENKYLDTLINFPEAVNIAELLASDDELKIKLFLNMTHQIFGRGTILFDENKNLSELIVTDNKKIVRVSCPTDTSGYLIERQDISDALHDKKTITTIFKNNNLYISSTVPIKDKDSQLILGSLNALIKINDDLLDHIFPPPDIEFAILDNNGHIYGITSNLKKLKNLINKNLLSKNEEFIKLKPENNISYLIKKTKINPIKNNQNKTFYFLTFINNTESRYLQYTVLRRVAAVGLVIFSIAIIIATILSNKITIPIRKLSTVVKEISKENKFVNKNIDINSNDEIGELAESFNKMISNLRDVQYQLVRKSKLASIGELAAGVSHEINNPLVTILGYSQLALENLEKKEKLEKYIKVIESDAKRCKKVTHNLLSFARQSGKELRSININELLYSVVVLFGHQTKKKNIKLVSELTKEIPNLKIDVDQIKQVLVNIIINAIHAIEEKKSAKGQIIFRSYKDTKDEYVVVEIEDNGIGMSENSIEKIFDPFFTSKRSGQGTGLGLSISYGIIEAHSGKIEVESILGEKSIFKLYLPI